MKQKLLFIANTDSFFMSHRLPIAQLATKKGYEVHLLTEVTKHRKTLSEFGVHVHDIGVKRDQKGSLDNLKMLLAIFRHYRVIQPDIVHLVSIKPIIFGGLLARFLRVPSAVFALSGLGYVYTSNSFKLKILQIVVNFLYNIIFKHKNSCVIVQNQADSVFVQKKFGAQKTKVILLNGSGVDLEKFYPSKNTPSISRVVMVSRMLYDKGVEEFVQAALILNAKYSEVKFTLVGEPDFGNPSSVQIEKLVEWRERGIIDWLGQIDDVVGVYQSAEIVVLPSYREGLPKTLLEAAACGKPVVTTDVPGCRDAMIPGCTGLIVPARDPLALANAIHALLLDKGKRKNFGIMGRKLMQSKFDVNLIAMQHMKVYAGLTSTNKPSQ